MTLGIQSCARGEKFEDFIFIISQPRSGSTLLQKILSKSNEVATCSESWLMLLALLPIANISLGASFNETLAWRGVREFENLLPKGRSDFVLAIRDAYSSLLRLAIAEQSKSKFVDKTPRYYQIIPELMEVFPGSKIVLLVRNPLAVLVSNLNTWGSTNYGGLKHWRKDLLLAPKLLAEAMKSSSRAVHVIKFENLVENPTEALSDVCQYVGVRYSPDMHDYGGDSKGRWHFGDQGSLYQNRSVNSEFASRWKESLSDPCYWRMCQEYAEYLGPSLFESLGYPWADIQNTLDDWRPSKLKQTVSTSLWSALESDSTMPHRFGGASWMKMQIRRGISRRHKTVK